MKTKRLLTAVILMIYMAIPMHVLAGIDNDASVVRLRSSCDEQGATLDNCFTDIVALDSWIHNTRNPDQASPVLVDIGPGTFSLGVVPFQCKADEYITLRGSGRSNTIIDRGSSILVITLANSCHLNVQDLSIRNIGGVGAISNGGIKPLHTFSTWTNVDVKSTGYSWVEGCAGVETTHKHFWFNSTLTSVVDLSYPAFNFAKTYFSCGENWFFSTEMTARDDVQANGTQVNTLMAGGEVHVYGGVIRAISGPGVNMPDAATTGNDGADGQVAVYAVGTGAEVHIHGAGIDILSDEANNTGGIFVEGGAFVHANQSSFNMKTGSGGLNQRIINLGGEVKAPYQWRQGSEPPSVVSENGADTFIESDCDSAGNCVNPAGAIHPHMMVYDESCTTAGSWFDMTLNKCRGD